MAVTMDKNTLLQHVRSIAEDYVKQNLPAEYPYFSLVWDEIKHPLLTGHAEIPKKKASWLTRFLPKGLGFDGGKSTSVMTPALIFIIESVVQECRASIGIPSQMQLVRAVRDCAKALNVPTEDAQKMQSSLPGFLEKSIAELFTALKSPSEVAPVSSGGIVSPATKQHVPGDTARTCIVWTSEEWGQHDKGYAATQPEVDDLAGQKDTRFDVFIQARSVFIRRNGRRRLHSLSIRRELFRMLVVLLRYSPFPVPAKELYLRVISQGSTNFTETEIKQNHLRFYKNELKVMLSDVKGLDFPRKTEEGYVCSGKFSYCVVMGMNDEGKFRVNRMILED